MAKRFLILTGPQGAGNHLFAKIFATDPRVRGWKMEDAGWQVHEQEPYHRFWEDPSKLSDGDFAEFGFTSTSAPYHAISREEESGDKHVFIVPPLRAFYDKVASLGIDVTLCIVGRDPTILEFQQMRRRKSVTTPLFTDALATIADLDLYFLSHENTLLFGKTYLQQVAKDLRFPIDLDYGGLDVIIKDQNKKYIRPIPQRKEDRAAFDARYPDAYDKKVSEARRRFREERGTE